MARIGFGDSVVGMGFRRGADCAQIGPGAILGVRASGNHGTRGVAQPTPGRIRNRCGRPVLG